MSMEKKFIAGCLQDPDVVDRARRAKILPKHLEDGAYKYLYKAILEVAKKETPTPEAVKQHISLDKKRGDHAAICRKVDKLAEEDRSGSELSLSELEKYRTKRDLIDAFSKSSSRLLADEDPLDILKSHEHMIKGLKSRDSKYELTPYYEEFSARQVERLALSEENGDTLKFTLNMHPFAKNLPRGKARGTTTAIAGPTFSGKSVLLSNMIRVAAHPSNGYNVLYVFAENMTIQAATRLDSILLGREYDQMYSGSIDDPEGDSFFRAAKQEGWGEIFLAKVTPRKFTAETIISIIEEIKEKYDVEIDVLAEDSPDHQMPIDGENDWWMNKGIVYWDNKELAETQDLFVFCTLPMKASSVKKDTATNEDMAGSYEISKIVDNIFAYNVDPQDRMLNRGSILPTKCRDGHLTGTHTFYFEKSHRLIPWEDMFGNEIEPGIVADEDGAFKINQFLSEKEREVKYEKHGTGDKAFNVRKTSGIKSKKDKEG